MKQDRAYEAKGKKGGFTGKGEHLFSRFIPLDPISGILAQRLLAVGIEHIYLERWILDCIILD